VTARLERRVLGWMMAAVAAVLDRRLRKLSALRATPERGDERRPDDPG
jgi:hypothetical protein